MVRILLTRRVLGFTVLVILLIPAFIFLGLWQWDRYEERLSATNLQEENANAEPVDFSELSDPGGELAPGDRWRATTVTGTYDPANELLVRNRSSDQGAGFYVLTPLRTEDGSAVLVNRGWVTRPQDAAADPDVPAPPPGEVTVTGRAQLSETEETTGIRLRDELPPGHIMLIDVPRIGDGLPYPLYGGFVELVEQEPAADSGLLPVAVDGYNYGLNLAYAVQWWAFGVIAVGGWYFLVRREAHEEGQDGGSADGAQDAPSGEPAGAAPHAQG